MISVRAIVFDLDGTLFDHVGSARAGLGTWLSKSGVRVTDELEAAWFAPERTHFRPWRDGLISWEEQRRRRLREFLPLVGGSAGTDNDLDVLFHTGFLAGYEEAWRGYDDVEDGLATLESRGFQFAMLTNGAEKQQKAKLSRLGLLDRVGPVFTAEGIGFAKPKPEAFATVCSSLGVAPDQVLYVGDDYEVDVLAARAAGLQAVHLDRFSTDAPTDDRVASVTDLADVVTRSHD